MLNVPSTERDLVKFANETVQVCRASAGIRAAYYRQLNTVLQTGKVSSGKSLISLLYSHVDRVASHLYSPTELRFTLDFENKYPANVMARADVAANVLTRDWERTNTDILFGQGVFEALQYGAAFLKQWVEDDDDGSAMAQSSLVMPWQFGVYREDINDLSRQEALCETVMLSLPEVWRRIYHMPDAKKLFDRITANAARGQGDSEYNSFFHSVLSTSTLNTGNVGLTRPTPGGIVELNADPSRATVGPETDVPMVRMHELWVKDATDYVTLQLVEPDILLAGRFARSNLLVASKDKPSRLQPYRIIQPNYTHGYLFGRSELVDLIEPQGLLSDWADDIKRLFGVQIDKILGFEGVDGLTDELYGQFRGAGWAAAPAGASIKDLTPQMPPESLAMLDFLMKVMDKIGGFDNILSGQGEPGVRAGVHAETMMKTASPRLKDRSLLVERQCAAAGDLRLRVMQAKDSDYYWTDGDDPEKMAATRFHLTDLPDDWRVAVDSHSTSPIFADNHQQLLAYGNKAGYVDGHSMIDELPYPHKDKLHAKLKAKEEAQARELQQLKQADPEAYEKLLSHAGAKRR